MSDALCKLKHPHGGFLPGITMWSPERQAGDTKFVGPAYTVKYVPLDDPTPKHPTHYVSVSSSLSSPGCAHTHARNMLTNSCPHARLHACLRHT